MKSLITLATAVTIATLATGVFAQPTTAEANASPSASPTQRQKMDKDGDGRISRAEAANRPKMAQYFDQIDTNKDGYLSRDELKAAQAMRKAQKTQ